MIQLLIINLVIGFLIKWIYESKPLKTLSIKFKNFKQLVRETAKEELDVELKNPDKDGKIKF